MQKEIIIIHNIPSPYRVHLFNCLSFRCAEHGYHLRVHFFGKNNPDRPKSWEEALKIAKFDYKVWEGKLFVIRGVYIWMNVKLLWKLHKEKITILIHGGIWDSLTSLLALFFVKPKIRIAWAEFNIDVPGKTNGFILIAKKILLNRFKKLLVPGIKSIQYLDKYFGEGHYPNIVMLPNIVDENKFIQTPSKGDILTVKQKIGLKKLTKEERILIWPARMIPAKGIIEFIEKVDTKLLINVLIIIVGDGPLRPEIKKLILKKELSSTIILSEQYLGHDMMPAVYHSADAFLLPSLNDPNPLSVIEAMYSGLPILVSNRIGNYHEAVVNDVNGYGFDPYDESSIKKAIRKFQSLSNTECKIMGMHSRKIAEKNWGSKHVTEKCVNKLLEGLF